MRLIDADERLTERKKSKYYHLPNGDIAIPIIDVEHAPTVQPARKHGKWKPVEPPWFECSECGAWRSNVAFLENFCPNCGADMRKENES